ncbi:hypothetical protein CNR22_02085 [Sphingobacteriaceae bacterium]|nr:hypothetical protein CNR22_02085 [Sphingobacteriaceae bacterium]
MNATFELLKIKADLMLKKHAIKENEVLDLLGEELPEINSMLEKTANSNNIYTVIQCFADFTKYMVNRGNLKEVKHCFNLADKMLQDGNKAVQNAIENVYVFSVSKCLDFATPLSYKIKGIMNAALLKEYRRQILSSGI